MKLSVAERKAGVRIAARVTIRQAHRMTPSGRRAIADWLRNHADALVSEGKRYAPSFTGRYYYRGR